MTVPRILAAALLLAAGACTGAPPADDAAPAAGSSAVGEAAPPAAPAPGAAWTVEDSIRAAREDSTYEARNYETRRAAMDSYDGCMAKAAEADPPQRAVLEAACARARPIAPR